MVNPVGKFADDLYSFIANPEARGAGIVKAARSIGTALNKVITKIEIDMFSCLYKNEISKLSKTFENAEHDLNIIKKKLHTFVDKEYETAEQVDTAYEEAILLSGLATDLFNTSSNVVKFAKKVHLESELKRATSFQDQARQVVEDFEKELRSVLAQKHKAYEEAQKPQSSESAEIAEGLPQPGPRVAAAPPFEFKASPSEKAPAKRKSEAAAPKEKTISRAESRLEETRERRQAAIEAKRQAAPEQPKFEPKLPKEGVSWADAVRGGKQLGAEQKAPPKAPEQPKREIKQTREGVSYADAARRGQQAEAERKAPPRATEPTTSQEKAKESAPAAPKFEPKLPKKGVSWADAARRGQEAEAKRGQEAEVKQNKVEESPAKQDKPLGKVARRRLERYGGAPRPSKKAAEASAEEKKPLGKVARRRLERYGGGPRPRTAKAPKTQREEWKVIEGGKKVPFSRSKAKQAQEAAKLAKREAAAAERASVKEPAKPLSKNAARRAARHGSGPRPASVNILKKFNKILNRNDSAENGWKIPDRLAEDFRSILKALWGPTSTKALRREEIAQWSQDTIATVKAAITDSGELSGDIAALLDQAQDRAELLRHPMNRVCDQVNRESGLASDKDVQQALTAFEKAVSQAIKSHDLSSSHSQLVFETRHRPIFEAMLTLEETIENRLGKLPERLADTFDVLEAIWAPKMELTDYRLTQYPLPAKDMIDEIVAQLEENRTGLSEQVLNEELQDVELGELKEALATFAESLRAAGDFIDQDVVDAASDLLGALDDAQQQLQSATLRRLGPEEALIVPNGYLSPEIADLLDNIEDNLKEALGDFLLVEEMGE